MLILALKKNTRNNKGITLIELIVSLAVLGLIVVPFSGVFIQSVRINTLANDKLEASQLAQQYMERYKALPMVSDTPTPLEETAGRFTIATTVAHQGVDAFPIGSDFTNVDFIATRNDSTADTGAGIIITNDDTPVNSISISASGDMMLDMTLNSTLNVKHTTLLAPLSYSLNGSIVKIMVLVNTNSKTTINLNNALTGTPETSCEFYIVRKAGKTGAVQVNNRGGIVKVIDNLYDSTVDTIFSQYRLYKITVEVYKGAGISGEKLITLESMKKVE